ncbi:MAG: ATP-binding protein [Burkholderiales bacterium]|nr:ATP-binding protein [Burkholderiales bacterium]
MLHAFAEHPQTEQPGQVVITAELLNDTPDEQVQLIVSDNGSGIAEDNLGRIFDPFFTTKLGRGGSGLGLNIVYNIVSDVLGGSIRVESRLGLGTRFILRLPLHAPSSAESSPYQLS